METLTKRVRFIQTSKKTLVDLEFVGKDIIFGNCVIATERYAELPCFALVVEERGLLVTAGGFVDALNVAIPSDTVCPWGKAVHLYYNTPFTTFQWILCAADDSFAAYDARLRKIFGLDYEDRPAMMQLWYPLPKAALQTTPVALIPLKRPSHVEPRNKPDHKVYCNLCSQRIGRVSWLITECGHNWHYDCFRYYKRYYELCSCGARTDTVHERSTRTKLHLCKLKPCSACLLKTVTHTCCDESKVPIVVRMQLRPIQGRAMACDDELVPSDDDSVDEDDSSQEDDVPCVLDGLSDVSMEDTCAWAMSVPIRDQSDTEYEAYRSDGWETNGSDYDCFTDSDSDECPGLADYSGSDTDSDVDMTDLPDLLDEQGRVVREVRAWAMDAPAAPGVRLGAGRAARRRERQKERQVDRQLLLKGEQAAERDKQRVDAKLVELSKLREMKAEVVEERKKLQQQQQIMALKRKEMVAQASDGSNAFMLYGNARYLRSVLLPAEGAVAMPDDYTRLKYTKTETVTYNVQSPPSGLGVFIIYPNHPTSLIGYHYPWTGAGYELGNVLLTAQALKESYDYARKSSQTVRIQSTTLPAGTYALNGTFNAITMVGTVTEIPGLNTTQLYNSILTNTVNPLDKLGNVLVGDGITLLSLPESLGQPMTRLGDKSPGTVSAGTEVDVSNAITDTSQGLAYNAQYNTFGFGILAAGTGIVHQSFKNVDSTCGVEFTYNLDFSAVGALNTLGVAIEVELLDPFGNSIAVDDFDSRVVANAGGEITVTWSKFVDPGLSVGPIGSVHTTVRVTPVAAIVAGVLGLSARYAAPAAARIGVNQPIQVVTYAGVAEGTAITVSGLSNYELVPNPTLRQNLPTNYAKSDVKELEYLKVVMANRSLFDIRSVWNSKDYLASRDRLSEIADLTVHQTAQAMSGGDIILMLKRAFGPAIQGFLKQAANKGLQYSADLLGTAASGDVVVPRTHVAFADDRVALRYCKTVPGVALAMDPRSRVVVKVSKRRVAFPVVIEHVDGTLKGVRLYLCSRNYIGPVPRGSTPTPDAYRIYGYAVPAFPFDTYGDIYLTPIDTAAFAVGTLRPVDGPVVAGTSCEAAIWLVVHGGFDRLLPYAVTGAVVGHEIQPNGAFVRKQAALRKLGINLGGASDNADVVLHDLRHVTGEEMARENVL